MPAPHFSVIMPVYNAEAFVSAAMHSVLTQTDADLELIVVNDGSTDHSIDRIAAIEDSRVRLLSIPASGRPAVPRNVGIQCARGEWIAFLDADDTWTPFKLAACRAGIESHPRAGLHFSNGWIGQEASGLQAILPSEFPERIEPGDERLVLLNYIPLSSVMVRRSLLLAEPFDARRDLRAVEDYDLWLKLNQRTAFHYISEPLFFKRMHEANISANRALQLERIHSLLDAMQTAGGYPEELISLARTLYDARYRPCAQTRIRAALEVGAAMFERPVRTFKRLAALTAMSRAPRLRKRPISISMPTRRDVGDRVRT